MTTTCLPTDDTPLTPALLTSPSSVHLSQVSCLHETRQDAAGEDTRDPAHRGYVAPGSLIHEYLQTTVSETEAPPPQLREPGDVPPTKRVRLLTDSPREHP